MVEFGVVAGVDTAELVAIWFFGEERFEDVGCKGRSVVAFVR
jgi:hypothetical protein